MPSDIDMASNALILLGDNPIASFSDAGAGAQTAANLYPSAYEQFLSEHPWSFALKELELSRLSQAPDDLTNFQYAYQMPSDLIRLWKLMPHSFYTIVGSYLYSNENELLARYVYKIAETLLPPHAVVALQYKLAADFSMAITESISMAEAFEKQYRRYLSIARSVDSQGRPQVPIVDSPFVDVRLSGGRFFE